MLSAIKPDRARSSSAATAAWLRMSARWPSHAEAGQGSPHSSALAPCRPTDTAGSAAWSTKDAADLDDGGLVVNTVLATARHAAAHIAAKSSVQREWVLQAGWLARVYGT